MKNRPRVLVRVGPVECSECGHVARSHEEAIAQGWVRYRCQEEPVWHCRECRHPVIS